MSAPIQRLYLDNGNKNPAIDSSMLAANIHALFSNWVLTGYHERDFIEAAEHMAGVIYAEYLIMGGPDLKNEVVDNVHVEKTKDMRQLGMEKPRFYNQEGDIECGFDMDSIRKALASRFVEWVQRGYHGRDFLQAVKDESIGVYYSYDICRTLGGLGGGKSEAEFLDTPFASM